MAESNLWASLDNFSTDLVGVVSADDHERKADAINKLSARALADGALNVQWSEFGAIGDGVANDTTAVLAAINAAGEGGTVFFPQGTYLTDTIVLTAAQNGITFAGGGSSSVIKNRMTNGQHLLWVKANDVTVKDLKIDGSRSIQTVNTGVSVAVGEEPPGTQFRNFSMTGCWVTGNGFSICSLNNVEGVRISNNYLSDNWDTCVDVLDGSENVVVSGNYIESGGRYGVSVDATSTRCTNVAISNNVIRMAATAVEGDTAIIWGIVVLLAELVTVNGNTVECLGGTPSGGIRLQSGARRCTVANNIVKGVAGATDAGISLDPVGVETSMRTTIQGNIVQNFTGSNMAGIRDTAGDKVTITGNVVSDCDYGISVAKDANNITEVIVTGNQLVGGTLPLRFAGASGTGEAIVENNWATDGSYAQFADDGGWTFHMSRTPPSAAFHTTSTHMHGTVVAAATIAIPGSARVVTVTGNTNITSITARPSGYVVTLVFTGTPTLTDGSNLKLSANFVATADDAITLVCVAGNWYQAGPGSAN